MITQVEINHFNRLVNSASSILITSHKSPDDDSFASVLLMYHYLSKHFPEKTFNIAYTGEKNYRWAIFPYFNEVKFVKDISSEVQTFDLIIFLDGLQFDRFTNNKLTLKKIKTICIDHHSSPPDKFDLSIIKPKATSTTEIIYYLFGEEDKKIQGVCELFLLGILGDTGMLTYIDKSKSQILEIVRKLVDVGDINIHSFRSKYNFISENVLKIIQEYTKNIEIISITHWPKFTLTRISKSFLEKNGLSDIEKGEASNIIKPLFLTFIEGVSWGISFSPEGQSSVTVSARSLPGSVNVRVLMEKLKIGGGHDRAAGGTYQGKLDTDQYIKKVLGWMRKNKPTLT